MFTASLVPATESSNSLVSNSTGADYQFSSLYPTTTPATGPKNGISEIISARR